VTFLGEQITSVPPARDRARAAVGAAASIAMLGGLGALFDSKTAALVGATIGSAVINSMFDTGFMCGLLNSKEDQARIDSQLLPTRIGLAAGGGVASAIGGAALSAVSKKHPIAGAVLGASLAGGLIAAIFTSNECPKVDSSGVSGTRFP